MLNPKKYTRLIWLCLFLLITSPMAVLVYAATIPVPDTVRTEAELLAQLPDNVAGAISPEDMRDIVTTFFANDREPVDATIFSQDITTDAGVTYQDTFWEDMRVSAYAAQAQGSFPPTDGLFKDDGNNVAGDPNAIQFMTDSNCILTIPNVVEYVWSSDWTIDFWFRPDAGMNNNKEIITKAGVFFLEYRGGGKLRLNVTGLGQVESGLNTNAGVWNHLAIRYTDDAVNTVEMFLDNIEVGTILSATDIAGSPDDLLVNADTDQFSTDDLALWDTALSDEQLTVRYSSGAGTGLTPPVDDLIGYWQFDEISGSTAADSTIGGNDGTIGGVENTDFQWIDGHVGAAQLGSRGVLLKYFSPEVTNELFFDVQLPHAWDEGTDIEAHVHWVGAGTSLDGEAVTWGLEYTWSDINEIFGVTTVITGNELENEDTNIIADKHQITELGMIDATDKQLSSMLVCRVFRDANNKYSVDDDDYTEFAGLLEIDFHYQIDAPGSDGEYTK